MGILNITPDSFYDGGLYFDYSKALKKADKIIEEGADIIDIGGESTRPGSSPIKASEEIKRITPIIEAIAKKNKIKISVDTYKSEVAKAAIESGATMINDISGFTFDKKMPSLIAAQNVEVVLMHIKGTPKNMQNNPNYSNLLDDVYNFLKKAVRQAENKGIKKEKIIVDPGIGFGKTMEDNYKIINNLSKFKGLSGQLLIGLSRKSLIGKLYNSEEDRLPATIALNTTAILKGADLIRVHDVKAHRLALDSLAMLKKVS